MLPPQASSYTNCMPLPARMPELSLQAWAALDEDTEGELVDGRLVEEEAPTWAHELAVSWLLHTLHAWFVPRGGFVLGSQTKLAISPDRGRKPDVLAYFGTRTRVPDLVVEVLAATPRDQRRDRIEKKRDYATLGVGQYWLVDPHARIVEVLTLDRSRCFLHALSAAEGTHDIPGCSGLRLDLDALWAEIDRGASFFAPAEITIPHA